MIDEQAAQTAAEAPEDGAQPDAPAGERSASLWRYVGADERLYGFVVVERDADGMPAVYAPHTVRTGDVIEAAGLPADDGAWEPADDHDGEINLPDNAPAEVEE